MTLRARIDVGSVEVQPQKPNKFVFRNKTQFLGGRHSLVSEIKGHVQMDLITMFERGIKEIQKREFGISNRNMGLVLRNIKINNNIKETMYKTSFKIRPKQKKVTGKSSLSSTQCSQFPLA